MQIQKIIAKNFLVPGEQKFLFNEDHVLTRGVFYNPNEILILNDLINGQWTQSTNSFEKYYPKFAKRLKNKDMNFQIDVLYSLEKEDLEKLNNILKKMNITKQYQSRAFYYSIRCIYPYIFPIVSLIPAEFKNEPIIGIGNHYEKFFKSSLSKTEILTVMGISAVGKMREKYFQYKSIKVVDEEKEEYEKFLDLLKSTFRLDEEFIKKLGQAIYNIDDGDIINYADEVEFFTRNHHFSAFLDSIPLLREDRMMREEFAKILFDVCLIDLKWIYSIKTSNDIVEIRRNIYENHCEKAYFSKELLDFFHTKITLDKQLFDYSRSIEQFNMDLDESLVYHGDPLFEEKKEKDKTIYVEIHDKQKERKEKIHVAKEKLKEIERHEKELKKISKKQILASISVDQKTLPTNETLTLKDENNKTLEIDQKTNKKNQPLALDELKQKPKSKPKKVVKNKRQIEEEKLLAKQNKNKLKQEKQILKEEEYQLKQERKKLKLKEKKAKVLKTKDIKTEIKIDK